VGTPYHSTYSISRQRFGLEVLKFELRMKPTKAHVLTWLPNVLQNLPSDLQIHYIVVNDWAAGVDAAQNVVLISIPSVLDPSLAPPGKHVLHAYTPGTEPYALWEGLDRKSAAYRQLKAQRSEVNILLLLIFNSQATRALAAPTIP